MLVSSLKHALTVCHIAEVMSGKSGSVPELKTFFGLTLNTGYVKKPNLELVSFCPDWSSLSERWVLSGTKFFFLNDDFNCALFWGVWRSQWSSKSGRSVIQSPAPPMSNCFQARCWWPSCTFPFLLICLKLWFLEWSKWTNLLNWLSFCFEVQIERSRRGFPGCNGRVVKALDLKSNGDFPT